MSEKSLLEQWRKIAYDQTLSKDQLQNFWANYFQIEKEIYEQLLDDPDTEVKGTVKELAEKYGQSVMTMTGFLDGINDSLVTANPIETMTEDTEVSLAFDKEKLYKNMVDAKADWLYELPQWEKIFDEETRKRLYKEQKASGMTRRRGNVSTKSRKLPVRSASRRRSEGTIPVRAAVARNISIAAAETHSKCRYIF